MSYLAVALMAAGFPDQAREVAARTMRTAEQLAKPSNIAFCAINVSAMHQLSFNPQAALTVADSAAEMARAHGVAQLASALDVYAGWGIAAAGNPSEGADRIRRGITGWLADGGRLPHAWYLSLLGWSYALDRRFEEAEETMKDAAAAVGELRLEEPIVLWTRADILRMARMAATDQAGMGGVETDGGVGSGALEAAWRAAIESARIKEMRLFELRSTVGLARLLSARGEREAAREMLGPLLESFKEGAESFDIGEANRLHLDLAK
jgi:hypothetical protein